MKIQNEIHWIVEDWLQAHFGQDDHAKWASIDPEEFAAVIEKYACDIAYEVGLELEEMVRYHLDNHYTWRCEEDIGEQVDALKPQDQEDKDD